MTKCDNCSKVITKKSPGLECRSCCKLVHASQVCSGLTPKQLAAIRNTESLDWTCAECQHNSPHRKSSFVVPEDEDDDEETAASNCGVTSGFGIDTDKFLKDITTEMKKILKRELQPIETSVSYCSTKIDSLTKTVEAQNKRISELENKCMHLNNEKSHLQLEVEALKYLIRNTEQQRLENFVEISGIPASTEENLEHLTSKLAQTLKMDEKQVASVKRLSGRNGLDGPIHIKLKKTHQTTLWIQAAKNVQASVEDVTGKLTAEGNAKIIIRRALTKANKTLLWQAQQKLRPTYKYIWFQDGKILARKGDKDKPTIIRSENDVQKLVNTFAGTSGTYNNLTR